MRRREFITFIGGAMVMLRSVANAQQTKLPVIGFLGSGTASAQAQWVDAFVRRLSELGWIETRTVTIEYRWTEGRSERFAEIAAEFVRRNVNVIVTQGTSATIAAKQATSLIPIVFASAGDPVGTGLVASLARPGANVTGLSSQMTDTATKRLELLRYILPGLRRLAVIANVSNPYAQLELSDVEAAARTLGIEVVASKVQRADEILSAFEKLKGRTDALDVITDPLIFTNRILINMLALAAQLPTIYGAREFVEAGGLMSYGANFPNQFRRAADYVDKILRGAKPADLPIEQPTKFDTVINMTTAKALGLRIPDTLLATAETIE
jgi:putative tryptophan/tyrosine transport system substrate-binding protein